MIDPRLQAALDGPHGSKVVLPKVGRREGYAASPGSGPQSETCRSCTYLGGVRGNEYGSVCSIGRKSPYGGLYFINPGARACHKWRARAT